MAGKSKEVSIVVPNQDDCGNACTDPAQVAQPIMRGDRKGQVVAPQNGCSSW